MAGGKVVNMELEWDSENFIAPPIIAPVMNNWDGEDEEDNVKDNWEDEDEDKKRDQHAKKHYQPVKKPKSKLAEKIGVRERREMEERAKKKKQDLQEETDVTNMTAEQIQAEKLRRQKLQEEADFELAKEILGVSEGDAMEKMNPRSKEDFDLFRDALCKKVLLYKKFDNFPVFIEELFRDLSAGLTINELRKVKLNLDNMLTEKSRAEKSKKTKGKGKAKLRLENSDVVYDEYFAYTVDGYDDFM